DGRLVLPRGGQELGEGDARVRVVRSERDEALESGERGGRVLQVVTLDLRESPQESTLLGDRVRTGESFELPLVGRRNAAKVLGAQKLAFDGGEGARNLRVVLDRGLVERDGAWGVARAPAAKSSRFDEGTRALLASAHAFGELNGDTDRLVP